MASKITPEMLELLLPQKTPPALLIPRWGVVTSTNPLRVQLAGDDDPLPIAPKSLAVGLAVNAGHDLTVANLPALVARIPQLAEVSIGHGLTADALEYGMAETVRRFRRACGQTI